MTWEDWAVVDNHKITHFKSFRINWLQVVHLNRLQQGRHSRRMWLHAWHMYWYSCCMYVHHHQPFLPLEIPTSKDKEEWFIVLCWVHPKTFRKNWKCHWKKSVNFLAFFQELFFYTSWLNFSSLKYSFLKHNISITINLWNIQSIATPMLLTSSIYPFLSSQYWIKILF